LSWVLDPSLPGVGVSVPAKSLGSGAPAGALGPLRGLPSLQLAGTDTPTPVRDSGGVDWQIVTSGLSAQACDQTPSVLVGDAPPFVLPIGRPRHLNPDRDPGGFDRQP